MLTDGFTAYLKFIQELAWISEQCKLTLMELGSLSYVPRLFMKFNYECVG